MPTKTTIKCALMHALLASSLVVTSIGAFEGILFRDALFKDALVTDLSGKFTDKNQLIKKVKRTEEGLLLHVPSPDWREQIIYFLMIDRFNDGDITNNDQQADVYNPSDGRFYSGGDIKGVSDRVDYIKELGATAVWITPPNANLWWSESAQSAGYHGYWARNFKEVDEHYGDLTDYKKLSHKLHSNGMYLIQDVVINHTGEFFNYQGDYDPKNTLKNYHILNNNRPTLSPTQKPFDQNNQHDPEHVNADIYHWTPEITNYDDPYQETTYQLSGLNDLNTDNPTVRNALKDSFNYWINEVGVDSFRLDTAKYVETEFLRDFLYAKNGVLESARKNGKSDFRVFGEIFNTSNALKTEGEEKIEQYFGKTGKPVLNGVIGFPLYKTIEEVFRSGKPTSWLTHRIQAQMSIYRDPFMVLNFVDNHDTKRFQTSNESSALKQALALILTIPGIPVIYQGDEQALVHSRQAMFKGGYLSSKDQFDRQNTVYQFISKLAAIRKRNQALTKGDITLLKDTNSGPGIFAFERNYNNERLYVVFNTSESERLLSNLPIEMTNKQGLALLFSANASNLAITANSDELHTEGLANPQTQNYRLQSSRLSMVVNARDVLVFKVTDIDSGSEITTRADSGSESETNSNGLPKELIIYNKPAADDIDDMQIRVNMDDKSMHFHNQDALITGTFNLANHCMLLVTNGQINRDAQVCSNSLGEWHFTLVNQDFGQKDYNLQLFEPVTQTISQEIKLTLTNDKVAFRAQQADRVGDDIGSSGDYNKPTDSSYGGQMDISQVELLAGGATLEVTLTMDEVRSDWLAPNGFDHLALNVFFNVPGRTGLSVLPQLKANTPPGFEWNYAHKLYGWDNSVSGQTGASHSQSGDILPWSPKVKVSTNLNTISITYNASQFGLSDWNGVELYISTWDVSGEGDYRSITSEASRWQFSRPGGDGPYILDDIKPIYIEF